MRPPLVMLTRICVSGEHRAEVGELMAWSTCWQMQNPDKIADLIHAKIAGCTPAPVARNRAVQAARERNVDILLQVDDDMAPDPRAFAAIVEFLAKQDGPAAVGVPYCCGGPLEEVMCFDWAGCATGAASDRWKLQRIPREDAIRRTGIGRVANLGTGLIGYTMNCFDLYDPPYYDYNYDEKHLSVVETEDCFAHRNMSMRGARLHVDWDHWAGHVKKKVVPRPDVVGQEDIDSYYVRHAEANMRTAMLLPPDIENCMTDMAQVYARAVLDAPPAARFVEIGCWKGASTILLANLVKQSGKNIRIAAVDTFRGSPDEEYHQSVVRSAGGSLRPEFEANLKRYNVASLVDVHEGESTAIAARVPDASCDFVYIDAAHNYTAVKADIQAWLPKVKPGATLAGHDIDFPGVRQAVEELLPDFLVIGRSWLWKKPKDASRIKADPAAVISFDPNAPPLDAGALERMNNQIWARPWARPAGEYHRAPEENCPPANGEHPAAVTP